MKYSPDAVNSFFKCPFQWKLVRIDKVQGIQTDESSGIFGFNIHQIIQEYYRNIVQKPTSKQIETIAMSCLDSELDQTLKGRRTEAEAMIRHFISFEQSRLSSYVKPILVEQKLTDENFSGIIDYFDGTNIIDWKTGSLLELDDNCRRQGKIYDLLLRHNGYPQPHKIFFFTLANGRKLELPLTTDSWLMQQIERMFLMIRADNFPKCYSGLCNYCTVQLRCELSDITLWDGVFFD